MFKRRIATAALALVLAWGTAHAVNVVDTGTPAYNSFYSFQFNKDQFFAGEFSLLGDSVINSITGYFSTDPGVVTISLYSDGGPVPGSLLYSTNLATSTGALAWNGVSGLNLALIAGNYWVAFSPNYTSSYTSVMQGGAPNPLVAYAQNQGAGWIEPSERLALALRVDATIAAPVPEPTSIAMYGLGLTGLVVVARRRKQA